MEIQENEYVLVRGDKCKGPEVQGCLQHPKGSKETRVAGVEEVRGRGAGGEVRVMRSLMIMAFQVIVKTWILD